MKQTPFVHLVGAGPGDPDLLTVKALRLIQSAEIVVVDRLVSPEIQALINKEADTIYVGKVPGMHCVPQEIINDILVQQALTCKKVVRLKGGDPYIFGRGSEEAEHLINNDIGFEVVPGISAATGVTKAAGIPLTHRNIATSVQFVTGHRLAGVELDHNWKKLADPLTTLVIYMGLKNIDQITKKLITSGLPATTPAAAIQSGTTKNDRTCYTTLGELAQKMQEEDFKSPTLFVIGEVVSLAETLATNGTQTEYMAELG